MIKYRPPLFTFSMFVYLAIRLKVVFLHVVILPFLLTLTLTLTLTLKTDKREEIIVDLLFFFTALADYATNFIVLVLLGREDINVLQVGYSLIWAELRSMSQ